MRINTPSISNHRLKRFHRWALLWLKWFAAFLETAMAHTPLSTQAKTIAHAWLDQIERIVAGIVIIRVARRVRRRTARSYVLARGKLASRRAIIGARWRRALRSRDLRQRIGALSQNIETLVARLLKRMPCGLTRRPAITRPEAGAPGGFNIVLSLTLGAPLDSS